MMNALTIQQVSKHYGTQAVLKSVSLSVRQGEFFGLLGPNGAGKTTLIKSIVGLARFTPGTIEVFGQDVVKSPQDTRAIIGLAPQELNIDRFFPVRRTLEFQGGYFGLSKQVRRERAEQLMEQFSLTDKANEPFWRLSGGMQRRVMVARSLMTHPKLLILDEPTAGVDVEQRQELWSYVKNLNRDGTTIILTTHYIDEAEALCERVAVIHKGEIREVGTPKELMDRYCERYFEIDGEKKTEFAGFRLEDMNKVRVHQGDLEEAYLKILNGVNQ